MDRVGIDFDLLSVLTVEELSGGAYACAEVLTSVQGDLRLQLGCFEETYEEVSLLMISGSAIQAVWNALTFRAQTEPYVVSLIDHEPEMLVRLAPNDRLCISLRMAGTTFAQCLCDPLDFLRQVGAMHERVLRELFDSSPHLSRNRAFLHDFATVPSFASIYMT